MRLNWTIAVVLLGACSHGAHEVGPSERANAIVRAADVRFRTKLEFGDAPVIPRSSVALTRSERAIVAGPVSLPNVANGATSLSSGGLAVSFTLEGASDARAELADGLVVYPGGAPSGADIIERASESSVEDYLVFEKAPAAEEVRYRVDVSGAAGVRVIDGVVELLDASGAPRLRMARPWLVGHDGAQSLARVTVEGCAYDSDPRAPWGRAVTAPGASSCVVRVGWSNVAYPAVLDPSWTSTTGTMTTTRSFHTADLLASNKVLLAGGSYRSGTTVAYLTTAELYDPASKTFAATGAMTTARATHASAPLTDGKVLVAGGQNLTGVLQSGETYDPASGTWTATGAMTATRQRHQMLSLGTSGVLIAGGQTATAPLSTAETYSPSTRTFTATGTMLWPRRDFTLAPIGGGKIIAANGWANLWPNVDLSQCEVFEPLTGAWTATGASTVARSGAGAAVMKDGRVIVAGGYAVGSSANTSTANIFSGSTGTWATTGSISVRRMYPTLTTMGNGAVLAVGGLLGDGTAPATYYSTVEVFNGTSFLTSTVPSLSVPRYAHTATALADGTVLVTGGNNAIGTLGSAEIFSLSNNGETCSDSIMCKSGFCVDGVCCNSACTTACSACSNALTGGANGTCAPVSAGTDPKSSCKDDGSPTCLNNGLCDGAGACQKYPVSTGCTAQACTSGTQCASGNCYDGVCCSTSCSGTCKACSAAKKGYSVDGLCENIKDGADPDSECGTTGTGTCASDGVCNGTGACRVTTAGTTCAPAGCVGTTSVASESECSSTGACTPKTTTPCQPYICDTATAACKTSCASDADCAAGLKCSGGTCMGKPNGATCTAATDCTSGFCADGVCCNSACTGQCEFCGDGLGICAAVKGKPRGTRTACSGSTSDPICGNQCDGTNRTACRYAPNTTACGGSASCSGSNVVSAKRCNGSGSCSLSGASTSCSPFICDSSTTACKTSCSSSTDCASGFFCIGNLCLPGAKTCDGSTIVSPDGSKQDCAPYGCTGSGTSIRCATSCTSSAQCASNAVCDTKTRKCLQGVSDEDSGGCGCEMPGRSTSTGTGLGLLAAAAVVASRRRRR